MAHTRKFVTNVPENSETPLDGMRGWLTPTRLHFVRNHFDVPEVNVADWRLRVEGLVDRPRSWTFEELQDLPQRSVLATVECAGNGRSFLQERAAGVQWGAGAIGHAEWTGVPLHLILEASGLKASVREVIFEGLDRGRDGQTDIMPFARSLPVEKALDPNTILALAMNGEPLEPAHGFPVRLLVPGWYGVASVKWLGSIIATDAVFDGYFQTVKYTMLRRNDKGQEDLVIVGPMAIKSEIIRPREGETMGIGTNRLFGVAWAGSEAVDRVEVSTDAGKSWQAATLMGPQVPYSWTMWEYLWEVVQPGRYALLARAVSKGGVVQPLEHDPENGGYQIHFARPRTVTVARTQPAHDEPSTADLMMYDMNAYAEANSRMPLDVEMEFVGGGGI
jgi:DMSO/TMAO reductase YedYZ molybdopterin-dependent catalytic subunit